MTGHPLPAVAGTPTMLLVLLALTLVPGFLLGRVLGLGRAWSAASAPAGSLALAGVAAWLLGLAGVGYRPATAGATAAALILAAAAARAAARRWRGAGVAVDRRPRCRPRPAWRPGPVARQAGPAALGVAAGAALLWVPAWTRFTRVAGPGSVPQLWDANWHASVLRHIIDDGVASPTMMGPLQNAETARPMFYPTAWHALVAPAAQLTGTPVVDAATIAGLGLPALLTPLAAAALAWRMLSRPGAAPHRAAGVAAGLAAVAAVAAPVLHPIGFGVGAWPYQVAIALAMTVFALLVTVPDAPRRIPAAAMAFAGAAMTHPAAASTVALLVAVHWLALRLWRPAAGAGRARGPVAARVRDALLLAAPALLAAAALLPQWAVLGAAGQESEIIGYDATVDVDRAEAWRQGALMLTRHALELHPVVPLLAVGLAGLALAAIRGRAAWPPLSWALLVTCTVHGLRPFGGGIGAVLSAYTELHYATPHRLVMPVAYLLAAGCGVAGALTVSAVAGPGGRARIALAAVIAVAGATAAGAWAVGRTAGARDFAIDVGYDGRVVGERDLRAFAWLAAQPEARAHSVFVNPNEGSAWIYPLTGQSSVFRHYLWPDVPQESATNAVFWHADKIGAGVEGDPWAINGVDEALAKLDVAFIYISPPNFWEDADYVWPMLDGVWWAPGATPVYKDHEVGIVAVNRVVGAEAIARLREQSPEPLAPLPTRALMGLAKPGDPDADLPYVFLPGTDPVTNPLVAPPPGEARPPLAPRPPVGAGAPREIRAPKR